ncbi:hypothetical protein FSP39_016670 [Pinctada imbricata]|uniref:Centrosomal protein 43 n=1 Tax=Pinctada imbricata TaxID=66713 RepID=A0AA88Y5B6_PINIB|nr:hypothetical protein FSP39_016670 [Pinctada imbricata]
MSSDEDTELRDLVAQTLENNGVLGKIRAQLRASVFLALEEHEVFHIYCLFLGHDLYIATQTSDLDFEFDIQPNSGQAVAGLVREFLEFFNLEYTLAVFEPEAGLDGKAGSRASLARELNVTDNEGPSNEPLISQIVSRSKPEKLTRSKSNNAEDLSSKQIADARQKFEFYDKDRNGEIDKDELRALFIDMFPGFNRNMLDRYVNDEFRAIDTDFSSSIDFNEFLGMYKRLFLLCRTVVSGDVSDLLSTASNSHSKGNGFIDSKNQRNLQTIPATNGPKHSQEVDLLGSDIEEDPFFDDPVPAGKGGRDSKPSVNGTSGKPGGTAGSGLSSLSGLPTLNKPKSQKEDNTENLRAVDRGMADLGLDGDFDYDDDFQPSSTHSVSNKSPRTISKSEHRSEQNGSIAEEIEEEDIESVSIEADDLLKSERSAFEDLTTDRTISQQDGYDYMEDVQSP